MFPLPYISDLFESLAVRIYSSNNVLITSLIMPSNKYLGMSVQMATDKGSEMGKLIPLVTTLRSDFFLRFIKNNH